MAGSVQTVSININKIYRDLLHRPRDKRGNVYYVPLQNADNISKEDRQLTADKEYMMRQKLYCNSPTNLRRVWLSLNHVAVEYYVTPLNNNETTKVYVRHISKADNLRDIVRKFLDFKSINENQMMMSKAIGEKLPDKIKIEGRGFQALTHPWTCNNLEEIYFDYGLLVSMDAEVLMAQHGTNAVEQLGKFYTGQEQHNISENDVPLRLFSGGYGEKDGALNQYKRLHTVAMISKLDKILALADFSKSVSRFDKDNPVQMPTSWYKQQGVMSAIVQSNSEVWVWNKKSPVNNMSIEDFNIKSSYYVFDDEHLDPYIRSYIKKLKELKLQSFANQAKDSVQEETGEKSELEQYLMDIEEKRGEDFLRQVLKIASSGSRDNVIDIKGALENELSQKYSKKCLSMLGFN